MFAMRTFTMRLHKQIDFPGDFIRKSSNAPKSPLQNPQKNAYNNLPRELFSGFPDFLKLFLWHLIIATLNNARIIIKKDMNVI